MYTHTYIIYIYIYICVCVYMYIYMYYKVVHQSSTEYALFSACQHHRFYGTSYPTMDMSTDNLKYLHSEQALADLVTFSQYFTTCVCSLC